MFFSSKKSVLGLDIGTTNIKIAQITTKDNVHQLDTYGLVDVSFEIDEKKEEVIAQTAEVVKALMKNANVTTKKVIASLPNSSVFTSVIAMPSMSNSELKSAVEFEAKKYVPLSMSELTLSWVPLDKDAQGRTTVLITAVPNVMIRNYLKIFELAGLEAEALEIEALALIRSTIGDDKGINLLIDIGAKSTHLNITEKGNLMLTRNIPVGGDTITTTIAQSLKISLARAEQFKKEFGSNQSNLIPQTIKPILMNIKQEAGKLQNIYQAQGKSFDKIILVGGGSNMPGIQDFFGDLGPKVILGDPLRYLTFNPDLRPVLAQYATNLAVAFGLALRSVK